MTIKDALKVTQQVKGVVAGLTLRLCSVSAVLRYN
jgi:hypothetical protein